jgi:hypothetical protein
MDDSWQARPFYSERINRIASNPDILNKALTALPPESRSRG